MDRTKKRLFNYRLIGLATVMLVLSQLLHAQITKSEWRWIRIGSLWHFARAYGTERAYNNTYYEGMVWPADHTYRDHFVIDRFWIAAKDFTDKNGEFWPYYRVGFMSGEEWTLTTAMELKQTAKFAPPKVYVDGEDIRLLYAGDVDEIDPTQKPDRIVTNVVRTRMGLTMTRRLMAFSQQYHDNYMIVEYIFKNDGNVDGDDDIELPDQILKALRIGGMVHHSASRDAARVIGFGQMNWGQDQWQTKRGETYPDWIAGNPNADSIRCAITWGGQRNDVDFDMIGAPDKLRERTGRLAGAGHVGIGFLHIDKSATDKTDDPFQPSMLGWNGDDTYPSLSAMDVTTMREAWEFLAGKLPMGNTDRMDSRVGTHPYPVDLVDIGGAATPYGYGPWDLSFGDSLRIVKVLAINGLNWELCESIGDNWLNGSPPFTLPDGTTTDDADTYKNAWVYTGKDSILLTMGRAQRNFLLDYDIPQPPPPPKSFDVTGGGDRIILSWVPQDDAEGASDFGGYRIYRAVGKQDTTYSEIFACGVGTDHPQIVNTYEDVTPVRGLPYYYYIVAFNDGSNNNSNANPHGPLHSSRFYTMTSKAAFLKRQAGQSLDAIRVVPNPFYVKARALQFGSGDLKDRLMFLDIPGQCVIRLYTERGDLIETIHHTDGSGDETWNSVTSSRQVIVSGVYIAYFEVTQDINDPVTNELLFSKGQNTIRKFAIVR
jgi:hypothetical protein